MLYTCMIELYFVRESYNKLYLSKKNALSSMHNVCVVVNQTWFRILSRKVNITTVGVHQIA